MMAGRPGPPPALMPFARTVAALCMFVGAAALVRWWWFPQPLFPGMFPVVQNMKPNTAACFVLGGLDRKSVV